MLDHERDTQQLYSRLIQRSGASVDSESNWLITLSDVFTLLLVFMIMFLVTTKKSTGSEQYNQSRSTSMAISTSGLDSVRSVDRLRIIEELVGSITTLDMGNDVSVLTTSREVVVTMKEKITFRPGEADILPGSAPILDHIADIIHQYPDLLVEIVGHTDNIPISTERFPSNWELSVARATGVLKYFITRHAIDTTRLSIKGNADQDPLVPNTSAENRAQNRRVDIRLKQVNT